MLEEGEGARIDFPSLAAAIVALSSDKDTFDLVDLSKIPEAREHGAFAVAFRFRHQPYDGFVVRFDYLDGVLKEREVVVFGL